MQIKITKSHTLFAADGTSIVYFKQPRCTVPDEIAAALITAGVAEQIEPVKVSKLDKPADDTKKKTPTRGKRSEE